MSHRPTDKTWVARMYYNVFIDTKLLKLKNLSFQFSYCDFETRVYIIVQKQKYSSNIFYSRTDSKI